MTRSRISSWRRRAWPPTPGGEASLRKGYQIARSMLLALAWDDDERLIATTNQAESIGDAMWTSTALLSVLRIVVLEAVSGDDARARRLFRQLAGALPEAAAETAAQLRAARSGASA